MVTLSQRGLRENEISTRQKPFQGLKQIRLDLMA
jgi:hypothetical protein